MVDQLRQVPQVAHSLAVKLLDANVVELLIAQRGVAGQHLTQHNQLLVRLALLAKVELLQQFDRGVRGILTAKLRVQVRLLVYWCVGCADGV